MWCFVNSLLWLVLVASFCWGLFLLSLLHLYLQLLDPKRERNTVKRSPTWRNVGASHLMWRHASHASHASARDEPSQQRDITTTLLSTKCFWTWFSVCVFVVAVVISFCFFTRGETDRVLLRFSQGAYQRLGGALMYRFKVDCWRISSHPEMNSSQGETNDIKNVCLIMRCTSWAYILKWAIIQ